MLFIKRKYIMADIYVRMWLLHSSSRKCKIKPPRKTVATSPKRLKSSTLESQVLVRCGAEEIHTHPGRIINWCTLLGKLQLKISIPYDLGHPSLGTNLGKCTHKYIRKHV